MQTQQRQSSDMTSDTRADGTEDTPPLAERLLRNRLGIILAIALTVAALAVLLERIG